ncbi:unnamed protein product [Paramecium primaurelia]|uniref:Uncharacterized protein n=1 Tax=Paramecium primaurelia TaxID=5886 RepID=A0A8S1QCW8_PARPR|nr:unnamed protein product [Paramecium primaurelia]
MRRIVLRTQIILSQNLNHSLFSTTKLFKPIYSLQFNKYIINLQLDQLRKKYRLFLSIQNDYGFDVDEKVKEIHNKHSDEAIELKEEDDQEIGYGQEDETNVMYQAGARGAKQAAQSVVFQEDKVSLPGAQIPNDYSNLQVGAEVKQLFEFIKLLKQFWMQNQSHLFQIMHLRQLIYLHQQSNYVQFKDQSAINQSKRTKLDLINRGKKYYYLSYKKLTTQRKLQHGLLMKQKCIKKVTYIYFIFQIMLDIEELMQVLQLEIEDLFQITQLQGDTWVYQNIVNFSCNLLDILIYQINNNKKIIESLHFLLTLFSEFKTNQLFRQNNDEIQSISNIIKLFPFSSLFADQINLKISSLIINEKNYKFEILSNIKINCQQINPIPFWQNYHNIIQNLQNIKTKLIQNQLFQQLERY